MLPRAKLNSEPDGGDVLHDPPGMTFATGRVSFVLFDRGVMFGAPQAFAYLTPRIRAFIDRTVVPERRVDPGSLHDLVFERIARQRGPYWLVRQKAYTLRAGPYGTANDMVLYSPAPGFAFPPGRYRLRIGLHNYDFAVGSASPPRGDCVDGVEWADQVGRRYSKFEDCAADVAPSGAGHVRSEKKVPAAKALSNVSGGHINRPSAGTSAGSEKSGRTADPTAVNLSPGLAQLPIASPTSSSSCDQRNNHYPGDPAGHWTDGDPEIINKCECIAKGIRIVGERFGALPDGTPAIFLQVFNTSGERRTIWANVKVLRTGWETTRPFELRGDERESFRAVRARDGDTRITDVNVLGCS